MGGFPQRAYPPPLASEIVVNGGLYVPAGSLDRWSIPIQQGNAITHIVVAGDSVPQATFVAGNNGYLDGYVQRLQRAAGKAFAGLQGAGFFGLWRSGNAFGYANSATEWTIAGGAWAQLAANANDLMSFRALASANGAANILQFTLPASVAARSVKDNVTLAFSTRVTAASAGVHTNTFAGAGVLNVETTTGAPAAGFVTIPFVDIGVQANFCIIQYTGVTATSFTGCTLLNGIDTVLFTGEQVGNAQVITSATAAFVAGTDTGQTIYGTNLARNANICQVLSATQACIWPPALAAGTNGVLGLLGRNVIPGGVAAFDIVWVDSSISGAFSYSIDGGAFVAVPSTLPAVSTLKRTRVTGAVATSIRIRAADAGGVAHLTVQGGVVLYSTAAPTQGVMVHSFARDAATFNNSSPVFGTVGFLSPAGTDQLRIFDNGGDSTQTGSLQPSLMVVHFTNDANSVESGNLTVAQYKANIQTLIDRVFGYCDMIFVNSYEQLRQASFQTQATLRQATKDVCFANGVAVLDLYDAWQAQGDTGYYGAAAAGFMLDGSHPSLGGHADMSGHIDRLLATLAV